MRAGVGALMSKTDKTRPFWVKEKDFQPLYPRAEKGDRWPEMYWVGEMKCGCPMCSDRYNRKRVTRKDRRIAKKALRNWEADEWTTTDHRRKIW